MEVADPKTTETASSPIPNRMDSGGGVSTGRNSGNGKPAEASGTGQDGTELQRGNGKFPCLRRPRQMMARRPRDCGPLCRLKPAFQTGAAIVDATERY